MRTFKKGSIVQVKRCVKDYDDLDNTFDTVEFNNERSVLSIYNRFKLGDVLIVIANPDTHTLRVKRVTQTTEYWWVHPLEVDLIA
jgi:hypothetical protein